MPELNEHSKTQLKPSALKNNSTNSPLGIPEMARSARNKEYARVMCQSGDKVKGLYKMLSPQATNIKEVNQILEPWDDGSELRKISVRERMEVLRKQFAKNMYPPARSPKKEKPKRKTKTAAHSPVRASVELEHIPEKGMNILTGSACSSRSSAVGSPTKYRYLDRDSSRSRDSRL